MPGFLKKCNPSHMNTIKQQEKEDTHLWLVILCTFFFLTINFTYTKPDLSYGTINQTRYYFNTNTRTVQTTDGNTKKTNEAPRIAIY